MEYFPERLVFYTISVVTTDIVNSFENAKKKTKGKSRWCTSNKTKAESHTEPG